MTQIPVSEAQTQLLTLIQGLEPNEELIITQADKPIARLVGMREKPMKRQRQLGSAKGQLRIISEDDEHLADFAEYMS